MSNLKLEVITIDEMPFGECTYLLHTKNSADCIVIDPGMEPSLIFEELTQRKLNLVAIVCTHGHIDHIAGIGPLKERWPELPIVIGRGDAYKLTDPMANLSGKYGFNLICPEADQLVVEGDLIEFAGMQFSVLETPGHSAGHVVYLYEHEESAPIVLGGDVLFQQSVGRTDFEDGSMEDLIHSIHTKLFPLADDTIVYPGHGPATTVGEEKKFNPFVGEAAGFSF